MPRVLKGSWTEARFRESLPAYCFGDRSAEERARIEQHLFECEACWQEFRRLDAAVRALRDEPSASAAAPLTPEALAVTTLSGQIARPFGSHLSFVLLVAALQAALYSASLWTELGYAYDRFGRLALMLTPAVCGGIGLATIGLLALCLRGAASPRRRGLEWSLLGLATVIALTLAGLAVLLPNAPTIRASFTTRTAFEGYAKNVIAYFAPVFVLYVLVPFQAVIGLSRELVEGRTSNTAALLSGGPAAFHPRGVWYLRPAVLGWILVALTLVSAAGVNYLLDHVLPGPYLSLFTAALYIRVALTVALSTSGFAWYVRRLQDLKQLATLLERLQRAH